MSRHRLGDSVTWDTLKRYALRPCHSFQRLFNRIVKILVKCIGIECTVSGIFFCVLTTFPTKVADLATTLPRFTFRIDFHSVAHDGAAWADREFRDCLPVRKGSGDLWVSRGQLVALDRYLLPLR